MLPDIRFDGPYMEEAREVPVRKREELWAPFLVGAKKGPSTWAPRSEADPLMSLGINEGRIWDY